MYATILVSLWENGRDFDKMMMKEQCVFINSTQSSDGINVCSNMGPSIGQHNKNSDCFTAVTKQCLC